MHRTAKGFTLIELLIVVAIIAILAAIAVPNFLEAQTRSKISRTKADLRTQSVALEAYFVDNNGYTRDSDSSLDTQGQVAGMAYTAYANGVVQLTTPIAYMSSILSDPFAVGTAAASVGGGNTGVYAAVGYRIASGSWSYQTTGFNDNQGSAQVFAQMGPRACFAVIGVGPDKGRCRMGYKCFPFHCAADAAEGTNGPSIDPNTSKSGQPQCWMEYDPSNGTVSMGDVYQFGGSWREGRFMLNGQTIGSQTPIGGATW